MKETMTRNLLLVAVMALIALPAAAQTAAEQLQRGIFAQDSQGNLDGAITTYRQLAYSGLTPRDVAAQAQYRLAQALLAKGDVPAATREFERLERDFADYQKLVAGLASVHTAAPAGIGLADAIRLQQAPFLDDVKMLMLEAQKSGFDTGLPVSIQGKITMAVWTN